jgi:Mn-containing catalase
MTAGIELITAERVRQINEEGYDAEHDRGHAFELISAARTYVSVAEYSRTVRPPEFPPMGFPWAGRYWKPTGDPVRDLTKAGALIAAAIDALLTEQR